MHVISTHPVALLAQRPVVVLALPELFEFLAAVSAVEALRVEVGVQGERLRAADQEAAHGAAGKI